MTVQLAARDRTYDDEGKSPFAGSGSMRDSTTAPPEQKQEEELVLAPAGTLATGTTSREGPATLVGSRRLKGSCEHDLRRFGPDGRAGRDRPHG